MSTEVCSTVRVHRRVRVEVQCERGRRWFFFFFCITSTSPASNQFFGIKTQIGPRCNLTAGAFVNLDCCAFVFENVKVGVGGITSKKNAHREIRRDIDWDTIYSGTEWIGIFTSHRGNKHRCRC